MITAIYSSNTWFCKKCNIRYSLLYIDGKNHYCKNCLPEEIRNKGIRYMNQNREILEGFKEEKNV